MITRRGLALSALSHPTETICFMDVTAPFDNPNLWSYAVRPGDPTNQDGMGRPDFRHNGKAEVLFCDGHVKAVPKLYGLEENEALYWDPR